MGILEVMAPVYTPRCAVLRVVTVSAGAVASAAAVNLVDMLPIR